MEKIVLPDIENFHKLDVYKENGGYTAIVKAFGQSSDDIIDQVKKSGLRGRGGAAFLAGLKWSFMPKTTDKPKYLCVNGDESEPGSFKDRQILEFNPHQLIEGILITCYAIGAKTAYVYIRGEYHKWIKLFQKALDDAYESGYIGDKMKETFNEIQVVFQDKSPKMLKADSYKKEERIESDAAETGLQDSNFDVVLCRGGLNNVAKEDYPKILKEYIRVVKNDGAIIIQDHFARTEEERKIINSIETEIAVLEGREDETYTPDIQELELLIQEAGGKISDKQMFKVRLSLKERFATKGINDPDLKKIKEI